MNHEQQARAATDRIAHGPLSQRQRDALATLLTITARAERVPTPVASAALVAINVLHEPATGRIRGAGDADVAPG